MVGYYYVSTYSISGWVVLGGGGGGEGLASFGYTYSVILCGIS